MFARCVGWKTINQQCIFKSFENNVKSNSFSAPNCTNIYTSTFIDLPVAAKCPVTTSFNRYQLPENKYFACSFQFNVQIWLMYKLIKQHFFCKVWHSVGVCYRKFPVHLFTCRLIIIVIKAETWRRLWRTIAEETWNQFCNYSSRKRSIANQCFEDS